MNDRPMTGREALHRKLAAMPAAIKQRVKQALATSADEIVTLAKSLVPRETGALANSIGWTWGDAPDGSMALATAGAGEFKITVYAGDDEAFYARWVEFGREGVEARGYLFPAYRTLRKRARSRISRAVGAALKEVARS